MLIDLLRCLIAFVGLAFGLAWPIAGRLPLAPAEKLAASVALSLLGAYGFAWIAYVAELPASVLWALPALGVIGLAIGARGLADAWRDADGRAVIVGQLLVTGWCLGWLATIASYAGGGWTGDWFEHWERTRFFLEHQPLDHKFLGFYSLTARPPLVNVVTAAFLSLTRPDFTHYQLASTLLASLVFLPAALLARRFGSSARAIAICAALFLVNPLLVENATFAWTKLPTAAFVLTALYFFLRAQERGAPASAGVLFAASLAAGLLAHYSAGPYAVMLALGWIGLGWARRHARDWQRTTGLAVLAGTAVLATWFGWAVAKYGAHETFASNTSVTVTATYSDSQFAKIALNLRDTLVPHFFRSPDGTLIRQLNLLGKWSDWFFQSYQLNLPLACGSVAWLALVFELVRVCRGAAPRDRRFWGAFIAGVFLLGVGTHGARDEWGLAQICLQAFVLLAIAFLAARWSTLGRGWRIALIAGATVDLLAGVVLHGVLQTFTFGRAFATSQASKATFASYSEPTRMNFHGKVVNHLAFVADVFPASLSLVFAALAAILLLAIVQAWPRAPRAR